MATKLLDIPQIKKAGTMDRLKIVEELLESIGDLEITDEYRGELERRSSELAKKPKIGRSWSSVRKGRRQ